MHVAYIHQHFCTPQGSAGTRSYEMSQCLLRAGHRVSMICGVNDATAHVLGRSGGVHEREIDGIHVYVIDEPYSNKMGFWRRIMAFGNFARKAARIVSRLDADLVLATSTPLTVGVPGMKGARRLGVPFVFEVRDLWPEGPIAVGALRNPLLIWYAQRLEQRLYHAADHLIALAPGIREGILRRGVPSEKITLVPNGADLDLFTPRDEPLDDPRFGSASDFKLVFTGAHGLINGLDAVLDAAAELLRRGEGGIRFVFIGDGNQKQRLMERSRAEETERMISWLPFMPKQELARVLPRMNTGLMILQNLQMVQYATSPNKFFDYLSSGLPVINNYPGWLADMIQEHRCGIVVPPDDPQAFADAVVWLRDHRAEARELGRRGRRLAEARFSRPVLGAAFVRALETAYANGRRNRGHESPAP